MAAPVINNLQQVTGRELAVTSVTLPSYTVLSGGDDKTLVVVFFYEENVAFNVTGTTYGSDVLTQDAAGTDSTDGFQYVQFWSIKNPTVQTADIVFSLTGTNLGRYGVVAFYLTGADQTTSVDDSGVSQVAAASVSLTTSVADCLLLGGFGNGDGLAANVWTPGSGFTELWQDYDSNFSQNAMVEYKEAGAAGAKTVDASCTGSSTRPIGVGVAYRPAGAGGGSLAAGTASLVSEGDTIATVEATDATGGTTPYTYQWQRSTSSGTGYSNVAGATALTLNDTGLTNGVTYYYQLVYTDADTTSVTSNEISATPVGVASGSGNFNAVGTITGAGQSNSKGSGTFGAIGSVDGAGKATKKGSGTFGAVGTLTGAGSAPAVGGASGSGTFGAVGLVDGAGKATNKGSGTFGAIGSVDGTGQTTKKGSGTFNAVGTLTGAGDAPIVPGSGGAGTFSAIGSIVGAGRLDSKGSGNVGAVGVFAGAGLVIRSGGGAINAVGVLTGAGSDGITIAAGKVCIRNVALKRSTATATLIYPCD